jgi:hypothetical protein
MLPPPSELEIVLFWIVGIVMALFSGGVASTPAAFIFGEKSP